MCMCMCIYIYMDHRIRTSLAFTSDLDGLPVIVAANLTKPRIQRCQLLNLWVYHPVRHKLAKTRGKRSPRFLDHSDSPLTV